MKTNSLLGFEPSPSFLQKDYFDCWNEPKGQTWLRSLGIEPALWVMSPTCYHHTRPQHCSWWRIPGSNWSPTACKAAALPNELIPQLFVTYNLSHYTPYVRESSLVRLTGLEPVRTRRQILSLLWLPITPQSQIYHTIIHSQSLSNSVTL